MTSGENGAGPRGRWKRWLMWQVCLAAAFYVAAIVLLTVQEGRLIFLPPAQLAGTRPDVVFEDLHIPVGAKGFVHAWWVPSGDAGAKTLIYFHGNAGALEYEANQELPLFHLAGTNLLLVDYRGYGTSSALRPSGGTTRDDALASFRYLAEQRRIPAAKIVICGWSIGSGVATQLAVDRPDAGGLILVSPITSVADVANESWLFRYVLRPAQWLRHDNDFANKDKIGLIRMPLLLIAGSADTLAQPWMAKELYARAHEPKKLEFIERAGHEDIMAVRDGAFLRAMTQFLDATK